MSCHLQDDLGVGFIREFRAFVITVSHEVKGNALETNVRRSQQRNRRCRNIAYLDLKITKMEIKISPKSQYPSLYGSQIAPQPKISTTLEFLNMLLPYKSDFEYVIKARTLKLLLKECPGLSRWANLVRWALKNNFFQLESKELQLKPERSKAWEGLSVLTLVWGWRWQLRKNAGGLREMRSSQGTASRKTKASVFLPQGTEFS